MQLQGNIKVKDAIIVDEKLLKELEEIILNYYKEVRYKVSLCNGDTIKFDSLEELIEYENVDERKISSLNLDFGWNEELIFKETIGFWSSYQYSVTGKYTMDDYDKSVLFSNKINNALKKNCRKKWYTYLTKFSMIHFLIILLVLLAGIMIIGFVATRIMGGQAAEIKLTTDTTGIAMIFYIILFSLTWIFSKIRNGLLPVISFMIGEQIKKIKSGEKLLGNIFWGIIVASILTVIFYVVLP